MDKEDLVEILAKNLQGDFEDAFGELVHFNIAEANRAIAQGLYAIAREIHKLTEVLKDK